MSDLIERIQASLDYQVVYDSQPIYFKAIIWYFAIFLLIFKAILFVVCFITVPIWIAPYLIYICVKNRKRGNK